MKMRAVRLWSLSLLLLAFTCCAQSPADQLKAELQTITSWTATARMVGEAWLKGYLPNAYAARTLRTAQETISDEAKTIQEQSSEGVAELHTSLMGQARSLEQLIGQMRAAVENRDGNALAPLLRQLEGEEQTIKALAKNGGVQP
ncbi:MAG: hypothetical protein QOH63_2319 [Acidobacteriota bacterium]|jgi:hypothetical protein|nr:hypothetical protein [Acidobacteriota bacterium]